MYKKLDMAEFIEELSELPVKIQESVLKNLSDSMMPLEVDGNIFMVHKDVTDLIDNLVAQIKNLEQERDIKFVGKKKN
jgi:hypothetical protein|tara:strand:+ start:51 stop:284 length:234 start_codon:yes stop_codon:yes gene_type:complete